jgi:hypothetical protein
MSTTPISRRTYKVGRSDARILEVAIFAPVEDQGDYRCEYELKEIGKTTKVSFAVGVDSLQALTLALQKLGADVLFSDDAREKEVYWNDQNEDLGLLLPRGVDE